MIKLLPVIFVSILVLAGVYFFSNFSKSELIKPLTPTLPERVKDTSLEKYSFEFLAKREYLGSTIKIERLIKKEKTYSSYLFSFLSDGQKVTGQLNLPEKKGQLPVILMIRGYVDDQVYSTGIGTKKAAGVFAENGFITVAPDFLGFAGSDQASSDILEARFEKPVTVLNLLASMKTIKQANAEKVFFWAHSNGGQITLSVLEISKRPIPTTFWAPVTRGFPDSVTNYMGEMDDQGLKVKNRIDEFLLDYNPKEFSIDNYWVNISAPMQLHQGTWDDLVSVESSDKFVNQMKFQDKNIIYYLYQKDDHNLKKNWDFVVSRDLEFFKKNLLHTDL